MLELITYLLIVCPLLLYPIPYISTSLLSQRRLIQASQARMAGLIILPSYHLVTTYGCPISSWLTPIGIGLLFILVGQLLNCSVFYKLGKKGVYYGLQYKTVPLSDDAIVTGFPFCVSHPMYLGGCCTYVGVFLLTGLQAGSATGYDPFLLHACFISLFVQICLIFMETLLDSTISVHRERENSNPENWVFM